MYRKILPALTLLLLSISGGLRLAGSTDDVVINGLNADNVFRLRAFSDTFEGQLDPIQPDAFIFLSEQLFDGLVTLDNSMNPKAALAEYWDKSHDGRVYRFYLRKNVRFHHGVEMTSEDVKYSLERILDPETESPYASFFVDKVVGAREYHAGLTNEVYGFKVVGKHTIEIHWTKPYSMALYLMSMHFCKIVPRERVQDQGRGFFQKPSGTGAFRFDSWLRDNRLNIVGIRLQRSRNYYAGASALEFVEFCPHYNLDHFVKGEIEAIPVIHEKLLESDYKIFADGSIYPFYLGMSCHLAPLDDKMVRIAISLAINKSQIVRIIHEAQYLRQLSSSFIPARLPGFFLTDDRSTYEPIQSEELLKAAGYPSEHPLPELTLFLEYPRTPFKHKFYQELRRQLQDIHVKLKVDYYRNRERIEEYAKPYLILHGHLLNFPGPEDVIRPMFYSQSPENLCRYQNPELDRLLLEAETEPSWSRRVKLFKKIETILRIEMPAIPLYSQQNRIAMQPYVQGIQIPPLGLNYLKIKNLRLTK
jgi:ABC-type transport system substrate-binding protein